MSLAQLVAGPRERRVITDRYSEGRGWVRVRGEYVPDLIEAHAGERLRLVFRREEIAPCSERVIFPSLGRSVMLPPFEDVPVDLGPLVPGEHEFHCEFGVLRGRIVVRGKSVRESVESTEPSTALAPDAGPRLRSYAQSDKPYKQRSPV